MKITQSQDYVASIDESTNFNQPLNNWNVSNVSDMWGMFYYARNFNQNISMWNVSKVTVTSSNYFSYYFRFSSPLTTVNTPPRFR